MVKTPLPMQSENEGYTAMANALRRDPQKLRSMLLEQRKTLRALLVASKGRKDQENVGKLSAALDEVDDALARLPAPTTKPAKVAAADSLEGEDEDEEEADDTDGDDLESEEDDEADADESEEGDSEEDDDSDEGDDDVSDDDEVVEDDEGAEEDPVENDVEEQDPKEEVEEVEEELPAEPENPVAMNSRLRKEMGDSSADFLDDYGLAIHKKVMNFFESLMTKALDLGRDDDTDGESSLREVLRDEVGKRGIRRIEPVFPEWRGAVVKQIAKDVAAMFQPPEPEPEPTEGVDGDFPTEAPALGAEGAPEGTEEAGTPAVASTDTTPIVHLAAGRVSFAVKAVKASTTVSAKATPTKALARDFKPSGFTTPRLD